MNDITFAAVVYKVQTLADGGIRVTLDLPEDAVMQAAQLMECKRFEVVLQVVCDTLNGLDGEETGNARTRQTR